VTENLRQGALYAPNRHDSVCSADFRSDASACGRRFRTFNMVDDFKREALHIEIDASALTRGTKQRRRHPSTVRRRNWLSLAARFVHFSPPITPRCTRASNFSHSTLLRKV